MNIEEIKDFVYEVRTFGITSNDAKFVQITEYLLSELEKEKEKNKKYEEIICRVRNLSDGVVSYDIVDGKKYLGPRKNFSKQRLYEQFLNIELILKGNYISLSNEEFLKELIEKTEKE